jgi:hypothetical protein
MHAKPQIRSLGMSPRQHAAQDMGGIARCLYSVSQHMQTHGQPALPPIPSLWTLVACRTMLGKFLLLL